MTGEKDILSNENDHQSSADATSFSGVS